jgi:hypothetical protein
MWNSLEERGEFKLQVGDPQRWDSLADDVVWSEPARSGEIARACGFICVMRGTGENHFPAVRAQDAAKVSVGK